MLLKNKKEDVKVVIEKKKLLKIPTIKLSKDKKSKKLHTDKLVTLLHPQDRSKIRITTILSAVGITFVSGTILILMIAASWLQGMPELDTSLLTEAAQSSKIYDVNGLEIANFSSSENRSWVSIEDIPDNIINAFVSVEDGDFYSHIGIDFSRLGSAVIGQMNGDTHGGSTITQQLIKNVYLTSETTYERKLQEIVLALRLDSKLTKDEIMEAYLNIIYFGESNYGIRAASADYFDKELEELSLRECAMLAGLVKNPNGYSPRRNTYINEDMSVTNDRTNTVLFTMNSAGYISDSEYENALADDVIIKEVSDVLSIYKYPHVVEYVISDVVSDMIELDGVEPNGTNLAIYEWRIRNGGYQIYTTIDSTIQEILQSEASNYSNYPKLSKDDGSVNTAAVIIDHSEGHIVAMIGSKDEPTAYKTLNRATTSTMPVASIIKPLSSYAPAIEHGEFSGSIGLNYPIKIDGYDLSVDYPMGNMGTEKPITYREALTVSSNVVPAYISSNLIGYDLSAQYLLNMGISEDSIQINGSGLALGTSGINMLEMSAAYATLANGGEYIEPTSYTTVVDRTNSIVLNSQDVQDRRVVFSDATSWIVTDMLEDGVNSSVKGVSGVPTAVKTGTHENKCATFAGYTNQYTSVVWIGSDTYSSFSDISGGTHASGLFTAYMDKIYKEKSLQSLPILSATHTEYGVVSVDTCTVSGLLVNKYCDTFGCRVTEYAKLGNAPTETCSTHVYMHFCGDTGLLARNSCSQSKGRLITLISDSDRLSVVPYTMLSSSLKNAYMESSLSYCSGNHQVSSVPQSQSTTDELDEGTAPDSNESDDTNTESTPDVSDDSSIPPEESGSSDETNN